MASAENDRREWFGAWGRANVHVQATLDMRIAEEVARRRLEMASANREPPRSS